MNLGLYEDRLHVEQASRESILKQEDSSELHRTLTNLSLLGCISVDSLAAEAYRLFKECPPQRLLALSNLQMQRCTTYTSTHSLLIIKL
jgi:hypothetical protein